MDQIPSGFLKFRIFFEVPLLVELMFPERAFDRVCLVIVFAVKTLEEIRAWFALFSFESGWI